MTPAPREAADAGRVMADTVEAMRAVTIAAIHGHCIGGGVVLAAACDLRVAAADTNFAIPEVDLGIPLAWGGIPRLVREIGAGRDQGSGADLPAASPPRRPSGWAWSTGSWRPTSWPRASMQLAATLAAKSALTLEATKRHVDAVTRAMADTAHSWSDADGLVTALHDPESRAVATRYLEGLAER